MCEPRPTLLVVKPGNVGRRPVLEKIQAFAELCVLVDRSDLAKAGWAKALVGHDCWIEYETSAEPSEAAWAAVEAWLGGAATKAVRRIDGAFSYDEFGVEVCAGICEHLGLPCTPKARTREFRNKRLFRERCRAAGLPSVRQATLRGEADLEALLSAEDEAARWTSFPAVLKPAKGGGSWYTCRVDDPSDLRRHWARLSRDMRDGFFPLDIKSEGFVLEEYFEGHEVDIDGWARHGRVEFSLISDNKPAIEPHFLERGGVYPSQLPRPAVEALEQLLRDTVAAFPGVHCCFHFEAKVDAETARVMPLELNPRMGGAECPASFEAVTGYSLPEITALLALDQEVPEPEAPPRFEAVASTNLHVLETGTLKRCSSEGLDATATKLVSCVLFDQGLGNPHVPNNGSLSCLGWLSTGGRSAEEAEANLRAAVGQVEVAVVSDDGKTVLPVHS